MGSVEQRRNRHPRSRRNGQPQFRLRGGLRAQRACKAAGRSITSPAPPVAAGGGTSCGIVGDAREGAMFHVQIRECLRYANDCAQQAKVMAASNIAPTKAPL